MRAYTSSGWRAHLVGSEAEPVERGRSDVGDEDVRGGEEPFGDVEAPRLGQVQGDAPLLTVVELEHRVDVESPPSMRWKVRGSPPGGSIFTTSAPQSARMPAAPGPATQTPSSTTRTPSSGPGPGCVVSVVPVDLKDGPGVVRQARPSDGEAVASAGAERLEVAQDVGVALRVRGAVGQVQGARDEAGLVRGEEGREVGDLVGAGVPAERGVLLVLLDDPGQGERPR